MKITSIANPRMDTVKLSVDNKKYELKAFRMIEGKKYRYYRAKPTKSEAEKSEGKIKERGLADKTSIIKHSSGVYLIYRFKDWKKAMNETAKPREREK